MGYFCSRSFSLSELSSIPLGNPLNPVERISLSSPTTTQPKNDAQVNAINDSIDEVINDVGKANLTDLF